MLRPALARVSASVAAVWRGGEVEGLATAVAAPSRCCQIIIITPFSHAHESLFRRAPTAEHTTYKTVWRRAKRGNKLGKFRHSRGLLVDFPFAQDGLLHTAGIPRLRANLD